MRIFFFYQEIPFRVRQATQVKQWLEKVVEKRGHQVGNLNFIFVSDETLYALNKQYLNHDYYTDIMTFPAFPERQESLFADIYISIDRVRENAKTLRIGAKNELYRVMAHGVLHLCGFDDHTEEEIAAMRKAEEEALALMVP